MIIDCIGCLHGARPKLEGGDLLIVTGDLTARDTPEEHVDFCEWLDTVPYTKKVVIAGNHDHHIDSDSINCLRGCIYLQDSLTEFEGLKIWGSPWSSWFKGINPKCTSFTYKDATKHYDDHVVVIPKGIDILITHEPAFGVLDGIPQADGSLFHVGSKALLGWLKYVERPKFHVFSHIHEAYGKVAEFPTYDDKMMISINCSIMNERYKPVNKPIRIIL
jgi:Icc-related predicted phosphoesterase